VVGTLVVIYLGGWMLATLSLFAASRRWNDRRSPAPNPLWVSVLAGAVWPLLIVGVVELSSGILYAKVKSKRVLASVSSRSSTCLVVEPVPQRAAEPPYRSHVIQGRSKASVKAREMPFESWCVRVPQFGVEDQSRHRAF